jgi:hypothetical protein
MTFTPASHKSPIRQGPNTYRFQSGLFPAGTPIVICNLASSRQFGLVLQKDGGNKGRGFGGLGKKIGFGGLLALLCLECGAFVLFGGSFFAVASLMCWLEVVDAVVASVHEANDVVCCVGSWFAA